MAVKSLHIPNNIEQLEYVHAQVDLLEEEWELPVKIIMQLKLVLEEILSNIIFYGYRDDKEHQIDISIEKKDTVITMQIQDDAIAFDPLTAEKPKLDVPAEEREIGGLGIHFIQQLMNNVSYERRDDHNILTLVKNL